MWREELCLQLRTWLLVYCTVSPVNLFTIHTRTLCILFHHHTKTNNVVDLHQNVNTFTPFLFPMFPLMMIMSIFNLNTMFLSRSDEFFAKWVMIFFISMRTWTFIQFFFPMFPLMIMMLTIFTTTTKITFTKTLFTRCQYQWSLFRFSTLTSCSYQGRTSCWFMY